MKLRVLNILLAVVFIALASSCRKGENDPVFTLLTRKARLANNWKVSFFEITKGDTLFSYDGEKELVKIGDVELASIPATHSYIFEKDGRFTIEITKEYPAQYLDWAVGAQTVTTLETGVWSFAGGSEDVKTKEELLLLPDRWERRVEGFAEVDVKTWEGQNSGIVYNLDMLKSSSMRWIYDVNSNTPTGVEKESGSIEFQEAE